MTKRAAGQRRRRLRAAIYDRVSNDKKGTSRSPEEQAEDNNELAEESDYDVVLRESDPGKSASLFARGTKPRRGWERIVAAIEHGEIDVLIIWEFSRADRKSVESGIFFRLCKKHGVVIHITTDRLYDPANPRDMKALQNAASDAEYESAMTSLRVGRNSSKSAMTGKPRGQCAYGYERIYDPVTRELLEQRLHAEHAPIALLIIERVAGNVSIASIVRDLNEGADWLPGGLPVLAVRGGKWTQSAVRFLAKNPYYIAQRLYRGEWLDCQWPALVEAATHYRAVAVLTDPTRNTLGATKPGKARYLLTYVAQCGELHGRKTCNAPMRNWQTKTWSRRYQCSADGCYCSVLADDADKNVITTLCSDLADGAFDELINRTDDPNMRAAQAEVGRLSKLLDDHIDEHATSDMPRKAYDRTIFQLDAAIKVAEQRARSVVVPQVVVDVRGRAGDDDLVVRARFEALDIAAQRALVRALVTVHIYPPKQGGEPVRAMPHSAA